MADGDKPATVAPTTAGQTHANVLMGSRFWINVVVEDDLGAPVSGVFVKFDFDSGLKRGVTTGKDGRAFVDDLPRDGCQVSIGNELFFSEKDNAGTLVKTLETNVTFKAGDTLTGIAKKHGLEDGRTIYYYPRNKDLRQKRPRMSQVAAGDEMIVPRSYALRLPLKPTDDKKPYRLVVPVMLNLVKLDELFAPSAEKLDITYEIAQLAEHDVKIEVTSPHYKDGTIALIALGPNARKDGQHTLHWDGKASAGSGDLVDRFLNPLYSPYTLKLSAGDKHVEEGSFQVLYDSIKLAKGPWTPDEKEPPESQESDWVAYKLNELGYYGGPVKKDAEGYRKRAIIRYKANHKKMWQFKVSDYNDKITDDLKAALKAGDNKKVDVDPEAFTDPAKESVIRVEALNYQPGEFDTRKPDKEKERLNRPLFPVEAKILLKSKEKKPVEAFGGVGPVRVSFRSTDTDEDLTPLPPDTAASPSKTGAYVKKALELKGGRKGQGDNCHKDFAGIRDDAKDHVTPFFLGEHYAPYKAEEDKGNKVVFVKAYADPSKDEKRLGKAGIFVRPSFVAGDDYKLRAELDFTGLPNKDDLEKAHGITGEATRIRAETGTFRVRRKTHVAMVIDWPKRTTRSEDWALIADQFSPAKMDLDTSSFARKKMSEVITNDEYVTVVKATTIHKKNIALDDNFLCGVPLPAQGNMTAAKYQTALRQFTYDNFWDKISGKLRDQVAKNVRKDNPTGIVACTFFTHKPVDIQTAPPGDTSVVGDNAGYIGGSTSLGMSDGFIFIDLTDRDQVYYVLAHEMGHTFWLHHFENAGGSTPADHDQNDHNCIMSYSTFNVKFPHQEPVTFTPRFCGKCNLKLRGWDINKTGMPAKS
ncbi:MAG: hypothetical protein U0359_08175 [Byssovorax sp.]